MNMEAIILAGGLGTRLREAIGNETPKCMAPVAGKPFLWYLLAALSRHGVSRVVLSVGHLRSAIIEWIDEHGGEFSLGFDYAVETVPLGTGGAVRLALEKCLTPDVLVVNGDTFFDVNLQGLAEFHRLWGHAVSVALKPMRNFSRYGRVQIDAQTREIVQFDEKQQCREGLINGGVYMVSKAAMTWPDEDKFSLEEDVLVPLARWRSLVGYESDGYFIDIGIPEDYDRANEDFKAMFGHEAL